MRRPIEFPINEIVPHAGRMCLLDRALEGDEDSLLAELTIRSDHIFYHSDGVGGWVGIEYMAQTVATWAGWHSRLRGENPKIGFLLGSRRYNCSRSLFYLGETLRVEVRRIFQSENGLGQFDCTITIDDVQVATAALTVFEPPTGKNFFDGIENV